MQQNAGKLSLMGSKVNISYLEVPGCWLSKTRKDTGCADADEGLDGCCTFCNHCSRLCCGYLRRLQNYVFMSCCGLCCFCKLKCGDLLTCCDLHSSALYCISLRSFTVSFQKVKKSCSSSQSGHSCRTTILDLE